MSKDRIKRCKRGHVMFPLCEIHAYDNRGKLNPRYLREYFIFVCNDCLLAAREQFGDYYMRFYWQTPPIAVFTYMNDWENQNYLDRKLLY
jgi:hypothetical protein